MRYQTSFLPSLYLIHNNKSNDGFKPLRKMFPGRKGEKKPYFVNYMKQLKRQMGGGVELVALIIFVFFCFAFLSRVQGHSETGIFIMFLPLGNSEKGAKCQQSSPLCLSGKFMIEGLPC